MLSRNESVHPQKIFAGNGGNLPGKGTISRAPFPDPLHNRKGVILLLFEVGSHICVLITSRETISRRGTPSHFFI